MTARSPVAQAYATARLPAPETPWRDAAYSVLDLETTGLDPRRDEIVSFAAVPIDQGRVVARGIRHSLVRPTGTMRPASVRIHGIRPQDVADAPVLDEVIDDILEAMAGRILVVHVDWVERGFLGPALRPRGLRLSEPVLDTARLGCVRFPGLPGNVPLSALADRLRLPAYSRHEALGDALTTAQAFLALATLLDRDSPQTVGSLCRVGAASGRRSALRRLVGR